MKTISKIQDIEQQIDELAADTDENIAPHADKLHGLLGRFRRVSMRATNRLFEDLKNES